MDTFLSSCFFFIVCTSLIPMTARVIISLFARNVRIAMVSKENVLSLLESKYTIGYYSCLFYWNYFK